MRILNIKTLNVFYIHNFLILRNFKKLIMSITFFNHILSDIIGMDIVNY